MRETVLMFAFASPAIKTRLETQYDVLQANPGDPRAQFSADELAKVRVALTRDGGSVSTSKMVMDAFPNLKLIVCLGSGYDGIDLATANARGIAIANSGGANASAVADTAMGLMLAAMRSIARNDRYVRSGGWATNAPSGVPMGMGMPGCKIGIYGMGAIGRKIAARAAAFESDVQYFSRRRIDGLPYPYHTTLASLADWCDVLVIAVRASPETKHAVNADVLKRIGPKGFIVNIARGSVIDEDALIAALRDGRLAGAGLDVYENEPKIRAEFLELPNAVLNPHLGAVTGQALARMQQCAMDNIAAHFAGKPVPYPVILP